MPHSAPRTEPPPAVPLSVIDGPATAAAFVVDLAVFSAMATGGVGLAPALAVHAIVVAAIAHRTYRARQAGRDSGSTATLAVLVLCAGPFGAIAALIAGLFSKPGPAEARRLTGWYERLALSADVDPVERRADQVKTGRAVRPEASLPPAFSATFAAGSVDSQQQVLGLIARRFHPDYLPALQQALVSDEPVIRVQAAAVAAKVRGVLARRVDEALRRAADAGLTAPETLRLVREIERTAASGLMEEPDAARARRLVDGILARLIDQIDRHRPTDGFAALGDDVRDVYERHLLVRGRYDELRTSRRVAAWRRRGPWRFRRIAVASTARRAGRPTTEIAERHP